MFVVFTGKVYGSLKDEILNYYKKNVKEILKETITDSDEENKDNIKSILGDLLFILAIFFMSSGLAIFLFFILYKWLFYASVIYEISVLFIVLSSLYKIYANLLKNMTNSWGNDFSSKNDNNIILSLFTENENNNSENSINEDEAIAGGDDDNIENILSINDDSSDSNDDTIFTYDTINNIKSNLSNFNNDTQEIVKKMNSNIDLYNEKIVVVNEVLDKLNEKINSTNESITNLNKKKKILRINKKYHIILYYIYEKTTKFQELNNVNKIIMDNNQKIRNYFINDTKSILFALKNLNYILNSPDNDDYINRIDDFVNKINKNIKIFIKRIMNISHFTFKIIDIIKTKINDKEFNKNEEEEEEEQNEEIENNQIFKVLSQILSCKGMFDKKIKPRKCFHNKTRYLVYKIVLCAFIFGFQFYSILYPYLQGFFSLGQFFAFLIIKIFFMERICSYNLIDIFINFEKTRKTLKKKSYIIALYIELFFYGIICVAFIVIYAIISRLDIFPTIDNAIYIENNQKWNKYNNLTIQPDGFCFTKEQNGGILKTEDFAMLSTIPRLYGINKEGKCYLKPSKRGLFNSTMKYIFGKNYENDGIRIMCKMMAHNIYLVITSENILNQTLQNFSNQNYTILDNQFNIENKNYFENFNAESLPEKYQFLFNIYKNCESQNRTNGCENEWDVFTQFYWPNMFSDEYVNITGFERYQINIDSDMVIQPSFITNDGELWSGTHYIVGGGYEDQWNFGFFIETIGRKYIPKFIENILPLYSFLRDISHDAFARIDWFNKHIFYTDDFAAKELDSITQLYNQFNFSKQSLFSIGHSISGTVFKVISFSTDMHGIVFEAADGESNFNYLHKSHLKKLSESESLMTNVYSDGTIITGNDEKCNVNGALPKRYILPNVYDTACLAAITCSNTMKYVPFCQQVLAQNKKDPLNEFNISFNAFLKHYGLF